MNEIDLKSFETHNKNNSLFITFEGIEGCGKTTQIQLLRDYYIDQGMEVHCFREPGGTRFGEALREAILKSDTQLNPFSEAFLFCAARSQLLHEKILPILDKKNQIVLCDRYMDSSLVYQGVARGLGISTVLHFHEFGPLKILPHKTFYIKIDRQTSLKRQALRDDQKDYFESENLEFYQKIIDGFDQLANIFQQRITTINGQETSNEVFQKIISKLDH